MDRVPVESKNLEEKRFKNRWQGNFKLDSKKQNVRIITRFKIHLKDIDDGASHFCILFIRTLFIVQFNKITTFQRLALSPSSGDKRERAKREVILGPVIEISSV
jgi:hypothetical protein